MKIRSLIKAGGVQPQHNRRLLKVKTSVKSGGWCCVTNHSRSALKVRSSVKAGGICFCNHSRKLISL